MNSDLVETLDHEEVKDHHEAKENPYNNLE